MTDHHALYFAEDLTRLKAADGIGRLSRSLFDACVDLNPHQIDAALFAFRSPASKGVILADEVGLGKTIEAGVLLCQLWAERRRRLIVVCPASLRKQWALELEEKFSLPVVIFDARIHAKAVADGTANPFDTTSSVVVTSYNFAAKMMESLFPIAWDLVVIDEAHKLRNVYKSGNIMGARIRQAFYNRRKVLLTATPLQNSLMELYGLSTLIDDTLFGDQVSFRSRFVANEGNHAELRGRLAGFCQRTLRADVQEYVRYTERTAVTIPFTPTAPEHELYLAVSEFLTRGESFAVPHRQRQLTTLVMRKLLASSSHAIAGTLEVIRARLMDLRTGVTPEDDLAAGIIAAEDIENEYLDADEDEPAAADGDAPDLELLDAEIAEIERFVQLARSIGTDTKGAALLTALTTGFAEMEKQGASRKALVFTESRRTQDWLKRFLEANGFAGKVVAFNGTNSGLDAKAVVDAWIAANAETGRVTGSREIDMRTALVEHFRDHAEVMLATEAASEGVNMQFCSLVMNYDLPWNPQRIEQRIGRCHRYGQKHDVVVINFLNRRNDADRRVLELLDEKFRLFKGVFGASDEVLGTIESGIDFEMRILAIYQECRSEATIDAAFASLRAEMDDAIRERMSATRLDLLAHFDEDVHDRLRLHLDDARAQLDRTGRMFWRLSRHMLADMVEFDDQGASFRLGKPPLKGVRPGTYHLISKEHGNVPGDFLYRLGHPLGEWVLDRARALTLPAEPQMIEFDYTGHTGKISVVEALMRRGGWLSLHKVTLDSFEREEFLVFSGIDDRQQPLDPEVCEKLFSCDGRWLGPASPPHAMVKNILAETTQTALDNRIRDALTRNGALFEEERQRLERWAEDRLFTAEKELSDTKKQIQALSRQSRTAATPAEQMDVQRRIQELERGKRRLRQRIFDVEDEIADDRDKLIAGLETRLNQKTDVRELFTIVWKVA
ncbi:MAG: DEAD/DEAH box helicase family protein [Rhodospirillaceae bacterium]|nr:DEAD/DEAH box helicase family protein [Rhodospirillales bacterium]